MLADRRQPCRHVCASGRMSRIDKSSSSNSSSSDSSSSSSCVVVVVVVAVVGFVTGVKDNWHGDFLRSSPGRALAIRVKLGATGPCIGPKVTRTVIF